MRAKLTSMKNFKGTKNNKACDALLNKMKGVSYEYDGHRKLYLTLDDANTKYYDYN